MALTFSDTLQHHVNLMVNADLIDFRKEGRNITAITHTLKHIWLDDDINRMAVSKEAERQAKEWHGVIVKISWQKSTREDFWDMLVSYIGGAYATT